MTLKSGLKVTQGHSNRYHSKASYSPSIVTMALSRIISEISDGEKILKIRLFVFTWSTNVENHHFFHTPLHSTPPLCFRRNSAMMFGTEKLKWLGYPMVKKILKIRLFVFTRSTNVTDRHTQTDRQAWRHRPRLCIASRGKYSKSLSQQLNRNVFSLTLKTSSEMSGDRRQVTVSAGNCNNC